MRAEGTDRRASVRTEASVVLTPAVTAEAGVEAGWLDTSRAWQSYVTGPGGTPILVGTAPLEESGDEQGAFAQAPGHAGRAGMVAGVRADRASPVAGIAASPWAQVEWPLAAGLVVRGGGGIFRQAPTLEQVGLMPAEFPAERQRAVHADLSLGGAIGRYARWAAAGFLRDEEEMLRAYGTDYHLAGDVIVRPADIPLYGNALSGRARGFELTLSRQDPNRLSGWISYACLRPRHGLRHDVRRVEDHQDHWASRC